MGKNILADDTINGARGRALCTIDGKQEEILGSLEAEIKLTYETVEVDQCGTDTVQEKETKKKYNCTLKKYYGQPIFNKLLEEKERTGKFPDVTMIFENTDKQASYGERRIALYHCKFKDFTLFKMNSSDPKLTEDIPFTSTVS